MTVTVSSLPAPGTARPAAPSTGTLTGLEVRKSLSTRSGRAVATAAVVLGPLGVVLASLTGEGTFPAAVALGFIGMLTALVLLALGVLSTAGEWTHKSVQTMFLLVPQRGRVLLAKALALALQGAVLAALGAGLSLALLWLIPDPVAWTAAGPAVVVAVAAGAAFAVIGAGIGAALGNSPAALTGAYLTMLGVLPVLQAVKPEWAEKLDPATAIVTMAQSGVTTTPVLVIAGWVVVASVAGWVLTSRRAVQ
ncbi:hypothetical protein E4P41_13215 [Geodermatophilus sp. DF01-2]|uniref:hypothetical protein n=1 Tax=Geodermatophilus sp. DF01-2 TaxID=2559610 RepID=UPI001073D7BA|nr:hypothetical protein [Geodermatophilus sp. DF01_2]TFV58305.1 hypothetical protein E4P41_13215 [Geodermatophilus sp. DF01_2]